MPVLKTKEQAEKEKAAKTIVYSLKDADRPLEAHEEEAERKAIKFSVQTYKRISPIPGTLAHMLRNLNGGNDAVIEFLRWAGQGDNRNNNRAKFVKDFIILWDNMDEFSKKRIDIFDWLCRKHSIPLARFWGVLQEGMFYHNEQITQTALSGNKPQFVERLINLADKEKHHQDRKLLAEAMKLTSPEPIVKIEDNSKNVTINQQNNNNFPIFSQSIRRSEQGIRGLPQVQPKALTEGEQNYIEAEILEPEKELVPIEVHEENLTQSSKEI